MNKSKIFKKLVNYKLLYTLPTIGVGLCFTSQTVNAMFKSSLEFFKKLESSSSGISSFPTRPLTSSTLTTGEASISSKSSKLPVQTSSSLGTGLKTTTSTTTSTTSTPSTSSSLSARPRVSPSTSTKPVSSSSVDARTYISSMHINLSASTTSTPSTSSSLSARPRVSPSTSTKPVSSSSVDARTYISSMHINLSASEDKHKPPSSGSQARLLIVELGDQVQAVIKLPSYTSQSTVSSPQETDTSKILTSNLGIYVKNSVRSHLLTTFNQKTSTGTDTKNSEILNTLRGKVYSLSSQTFSTEASR